MVWDGKYTQVITQINIIDGKNLKKQKDLEFFFGENCS